MTLSYQALLQRGRGGTNVAGRPVVCIQGLGFVGMAMAIAVANAADEAGEPLFNVIGVDLPTQDGCKKVDAINAGQLPLVTTDDELRAAFNRAYCAGNLIATTDESAYQLASVAIVDVHLDVDFDATPQPKAKLDGFVSAMRTLGRQLPPGALVLVETTVPPGMCASVVAPTLVKELEQRGLPGNALLLAHSYERVMPGPDYYRSIVNFWRVYAGHTPEAAEAANTFLSKVINVAEYPLTQLSSTTASEAAKILENSYRATNIAFIEEWGRFAEAAGIDLFEMIDAIRMRPTHNNIRQPGFGVGGYCLTKDPLLARIGARDFLGLSDLSFSFSEKAIETNQAMPLVSVSKLQQAFGGSLQGRRILLAGISYRSDVADTRYSPSETFVRAVEALGATVTAQDPLADYWPELDRQVLTELPPAAEYDVLVFAVAHRDYQGVDLVTYLDGCRPVLLDASRVLSSAQTAALKQAGHDIIAIGRGTH